MPVKFFPEKPIELLERFILKEDGSPLFGEIDIYRRLDLELSKSTDEWLVWHDLVLPFHSDHHNPLRKATSQIDFVIAHKDGILVLEVKGGEITFVENDFYYSSDQGTIKSQDPFRQSEGYKYTLKDKVLQNLSDCMFCHAVAFPHVDYPFVSKLFDASLLWTRFVASQFDNSIEVFIKNVFARNASIHRRHFRTFRSLRVKDFTIMKGILSPTIKSSSNFQTKTTLEWLAISNTEILEGLYKNQRIMIDGPAGSGKTTIAKAFIDNQLSKRGLYLCWNNLLMHYMKAILSQRGIADIEVITLSRFIVRLNSSISYDQLISSTEEQYYDIVAKTLAVATQDDTSAYDYIVVDEGQDIFDRGVDLILNSLTGYSRNGLSNGTILLLYDIDQSYLRTGRNVLEIADLLTSYFAHFKLNEIKRSAQAPNIRLLADHVLATSNLKLETDINRQEIKINSFDSLQNSKKYIVENILQEIRNSHSPLRGSNCVLLIESCLLNETYRGELGMRYWLTIKDVEELTETNLLDQSNKLRYTSILKYKGLEKENVFLLTTTPTIKNSLELYVGITRAIYNLEILVVK